MNSGNWIYQKLISSPSLVEITGGDIFPIRRPKENGNIPEIVYVFLISDYEMTKSGIVGKKMSATLRALTYDYDQLIEIGLEFDSLFKFGNDTWVDDNDDEWLINYSVDNLEPKYDFENKIYYLDYSLSAKFTKK